MRFIRNLNSGNSPLALPFPSLGTMNSERGFNLERRASCPNPMFGARRDGSGCGPWHHNQMKSRRSIHITMSRFISDDDPSSIPSALRSSDALIDGYLLLSLCGQHGYRRLREPSRYDKNVMSVANPLRDDRSQDSARGDLRMSTWYRLFCARRTGCKEDIPVTITRDHPSRSSASEIHP